MRNATYWIVWTFVPSLVVQTHGGPVRAERTGVAARHREFAIHVQMPEESSMSGMGEHRAALPGEMRGEIWSTGNLARLEVKMGGGRDRVQILTPKALYALLPSTKHGTVRPMTSERLRTMLANGSPFALAVPVDVKRVWPGATIVGSETVNGTACDIWVAAMAGGGATSVRIWAPHRGMPAPPMRLEFTARGRRRGSPSAVGTTLRNRRTIEVVREIRGAAVPRSLFLVPKDFKLSAARETPSRHAH